MSHQFPVPSVSSLPRKHSDESWTVAASFQALGQGPYSGSTCLSLPNLRAPRGRDADAPRTAHTNQPLAVLPEASLLWWEHHSQSAPTRSPRDLLAQLYTDSKAAPLPVPVCPCQCWLRPTYPGLCPYLGQNSRTWQFCSSHPPNPARRHANGWGWSGWRA